jgi:uncharacterized protein YecE (DUF72 family)
MKAPRLITHYKQFNDSLQLLNNFYKVIREGLNEKLGPVLFQLPPQILYSVEKLKLILESLDPDFDNVIEFRHKSWWRDEVIVDLKKANICFAGISYPGLPEDPIINSKLVYYRFHGITKLYYSSYDSKALKKLEQTIIKDKNVEKVFVYFNNTATAAALDNANYLKSLISKY